MFPLSFLILQDTLIKSTFQYIETENPSNPSLTPESDDINSGDENLHGKE